MLSLSYFAYVENGNIAGRIDCSINTPIPLNTNVKSPRDPAPGQAILQMTPTLKFIEDPAVWVHIQSAWWLAKEDVAIHKFGSLVESHLISKGFAPKHYMDYKTAWEILGKHFRQILKTRVQGSPIMEL